MDEEDLLEEDEITWMLKQLTCLENARMFRQLAEEKIDDNEELWI